MDGTSKGSCVSYTYDATGRLIEIDYYRSARLDHKVLFSYNEKGIRSEGSEYTATGSLRYKDTWVYDDKDNMIENTHEAADGSGDFNTKFSYEVDSHGNWIKGYTEMKDNLGSLISKEALYRTITYY